MSDREEIKRRVEARKQAIKEKRKRERIEKLPSFIKNRLLKDEEIAAEEYNNDFLEEDVVYDEEVGYTPETEEVYPEAEIAEEIDDDDDFDEEQELTVTKFSDPDIATVKDDDIIIDEESPAEEKTEEQESLEEFVSAILEKRVEDGKSVSNEEVEEDEPEEIEEEEISIPEEEIEDIHTNSTESLEDILNEDFPKKVSEDDEEETESENEDADVEDETEADVKSYEKAENLEATRVIDRKDLQNRGFDEVEDLPDDEELDKSGEGTEKLDSQYDEEYDEFYDEYDEGYYGRNRGRKPYNPTKKIPFFVFVIVFILIAVGYFTIVFFHNSNSYEKNTSELNKLYDASNDDKNGEGIYENLEPFIKINKDTVGYIILTDTEATGPVVQGKNNTYYLTHDFYKKSSRYGARFLDYKNRIDGKGPTDKNTVIYGEYTDDSIMFAQINKYKDIGFYKNHPTFTFRTLNTKSDWKIFACFVTNSTENYGKLFNYTKIDLSGDELINLVKEAKKRSIMDTTVGVKESDKIMTLTTNSSAFPGAKFVVMARQVRKNEAKEVDTAKVKENEDAVYPSIWYSLNK